MRGQGRPPLSEDEPTVTVSLRMTQSLRDKLTKLGGAPWIRGKIEKAKVK